MFEEMEHLEILPNGDRGLLIRFWEDVTPKLNEKIRAVCLRIENASISGVLELVPAFNSITIYYEPTIIAYEEMRKELQLILQGNMVDFDHITRRVVHVPVLYGGEMGPDLISLSREAGLTTNEVIQFHTTPSYFIYMMGFLPGFPYMGGLDAKLISPRLESPRLKVAAGSVGIAHEQTGIYPIESPGGWKIIGRTPLQIFNPNLEEQAFLFQMGDHVKFYEIDEEMYNEICRQQDSGQFRVQIDEMG
ncbi:5-oxoprolinase subunit PxpB [Ornithinibacillus scapharcae]|uniref:5-oxoprolinase subunit PxpB n=1 Tax=Ornithinibacillus scapharcae TaxID=1147159 RepID=UPI000225B41E|nr:5-oxoprolinase subunit PxpB [Ornithinibacillus scapharcae]